MIQRLNMTGRTGFFSHANGYDQGDAWLTGEIHAFPDAGPKGPHPFVMKRITPRDDQLDQLASLARSSSVKSSF